ncbi:MAG: amidohydrolase family protein [Clostridia bacterium]|nr:amidohydrolase family protein [Clostridia bacterium]
MRIFDMHIHARNTEPNPAYMLKQMEKVGIYGGCVFSSRPLEFDPVIGLSFEDRINEVLGWAKGYEDRIFPILWIHPYEENIIEKLHIAVDKGICGFKIICGNFYIYEEQCIKVLTEIAKLDKPVFFHTGILWDGKVSSEYNRPLNWEALLPIKGLRFSMGHCSWPWVDECIAMYGKFLNALLKGDTAEMFFDLTPGTPEIYREELLTKLYTIGYDVANNVMFGTDSQAHIYNSEWPEKWLGIDSRIMDKLGVSVENRQKMYHDNLLRFLGKTKVNIEHVSPDIDDSHALSPENPEVKVIIEKWYNTLNFPEEFDKEFKAALSEVKISDAICIENYNTGEKDGKRNLLSFLFMCESLKKRYDKKGIPSEIFMDTVGNIVEWTETYSKLKNELYLGECEWLKRHFSMKLFKLGRLHFCMGDAERDIPQMGVSKGDSVIEVHIPTEGSFTKAECEKSINMAKEFFAKYFPEYEYKCFTCHSWLLDPTLKEFLSEDSNIIDFQNRFVAIESEESDAVLKYVFDWSMTRRNLPKAPAVTSLAEKVKEHALSGGKFYEVLGAFGK